MFQKNRFLRVLDNSGVRKIKSIGSSKMPLPFPYFLILGSIVSLRPNSKLVQPFSKGQITLALVCRYKFPLTRITGLSVNLDYTGVILLNNAKRPLGSKIKGFLLKDLRRTQFLRVASLSEGLF